MLWDTEYYMVTKCADEVNELVNFLKQLPLLNHPPAPQPAAAPFSSSSKSPPKNAPDLKNEIAPELKNKTAPDLKNNADEDANNDDSNSDSFAHDY